MILVAFLGSTELAITLNASVSSASPASIALASPKTLWHAGFPRR
jgi:hypothetical protein